MATRVQIEARVLAVVDAVAAGNHVEDALVELKASWPDPQKAARRLAGHANAARGEDILWIIGLDEATGVCPVDPAELANWWPQVQSHFEGVTPSLADVFVTTSDGPVQALCFDTSLGPFVTKNPAYGQSGAGPVEREVPWREGTSVRSARREDLVRLLVPLQSLPDVEVLSAKASVAQRPPLDPQLDSDEKGVRLEPRLHWRVWIEVFISPATDSRVVLPVHRAAVLLQEAGVDGAPLLLPNLRFQRPGWFGKDGFRPDTNSIETTSSEALVHLPGRLFIEAAHDEPDRQLVSQDPLVVVLSLRPTGTEHRLRQQITLMSTPPDGGALASWELEKSPPFT